jgi:phosphoribosylglycinamide formyltransferase 1
MSIDITFLCSGGGGNLRMLCELIEQGALPGCKVSAVVADRECAALDWARSHGIAARLVAYSRADPGTLGTVLDELSPGLIVTTIHKILDDDLVSRYDGRLVNLHYSLLPSFGGAIGMEPVRMAREQGCRLVGATAHRVTSDLDGGPILAQACVGVDPSVPASSLHDAVFRCGAVALPAAIDGLVAKRERAGGPVLLAGDVTIFAAPRPDPAACSAFEAPAFWEKLR